jgi:hypothetical protein
VTSLVKLFFRELPESLLTFQLYAHFIKAIKLDASKSKPAILNLCLQLTDTNLHVLIYLMQFLKQISQHENDNKMNSFNLAVCFAPNIIYTRTNKLNELFINEERMIIQFLIENSALIGKVSDSVYERSLMLTSLCCTDGKDFDPEQESFTTARSTSLSSYCKSNKEKKKRRSSSLKGTRTQSQQWFNILPDLTLILIQIRHYDNHTELDIEIPASFGEREKRQDHMFNNELGQFANHERRQAGLYTTNAIQTRCTHQYQSLHATHQTQCRR